MRDINPNTEISSALKEDEKGKIYSKALGDE